MSISFSVNGAEVVRGLDVVSTAAFNNVRGAVSDSANELRDTWRDNAQSHVRHASRSGWYPKTIKAFQRGPLAFDIYPDAGAGQGEGFEFGSRNTPPQLDGQRAKDTLEPTIQRRIGDAVGRAL